MTRTKMSGESWARAISVQATFFAVDIRMIPFVDFFFVQCILHDVWRRVNQRIGQALLTKDHEAMLYSLSRAVDLSPSI
jgi:hypothetical protein